MACPFQKFHNMSQQITNIKIPIPYKGPGGVIQQKEVAFDVFKLDGHFSLKPCLSKYELEVANLPEELKFTVEKGKPVSMRGKRDGNFHVIHDAFKLLTEQQQLL